MLLLVMLGACGKHDAVGEHIPEFVLTGLDGAQVPTRAFRGKLLVLNVWATWCPPCRREMPSLERLSKSVDGRRIVVAGVSVDTDANLALEFLGQNGITFRNFRDTSVNIANVLGVQVYPETLLVAPDGKIVHRIVGERDWNSPAMLRVLEEAYQGRRSEMDASLAGALAQ
ncbi:MAG: TlpA family protein disulfide reductase [Gallionella sp.]|nr:MAG: TlpA family protein disulfide reductase [Gallionella sp.]